MRTLLHKLAARLAENQQILVTAESCTGGLLAGFCTGLPGSSGWFDRGFVTYSNAAKEEMLGVSTALIRHFGAVSTEVAEAMALGALRHSPAHWAVSVTGIAGPGGGSAEKPVGTVCFAFAGPLSFIKSEKHCFLNKNRPQVRRAACRQALESLLLCLNNASP